MMGKKLGACWVLIGLTYVISGCPMSPVTTSFNSDFSGSPAAGGLGATQGGVQDLQTARELVQSGLVPPAESFVVEGAFSEHELGIEGEACDQQLCLTTAIGVAPKLDGEAQAWVQVGMSSSINMDEFDRPSLTLIAAVDVSGSMWWHYTTGQSEYQRPGDIAKMALSSIAAELGSADQIAIVTYGSTVETPLPLTSGSDQQAISNAIDNLAEGGATDMESGLRQAYEIATSGPYDTEQVRVMLFTDVQPNIGATEATEFDQIVQAGAESGVGLTVLGIGVGLRQELLASMSYLRGGNAFSLFDGDDVVELMADDWPYMVSPIAYDLALDATPHDGFMIAESYGFPAGEDEVGTSLDVSTVFLSKRSGALLIRVSPGQEGTLLGAGLSGRLTYTTPEGEFVQRDVEATYDGTALDESGQYFEQEGVAKAVALAVLVDAMHDAAEVYATQPSEAVSIVQQAVQRFTNDIEQMNDESLQEELTFADSLLLLMEQGAPQGDLYGYTQG